MREIVHKMSDLKSPWNCPHGRPSLISLGGIERIIGKIEGVKK
jgi:DNA mismatch repair ATPase MutL